MLPLTPQLCALLISSGLNGASPCFEVELVSAQQFQVQLCFQGTARTLHFDLQASSHGPAGQSRSRQRGDLRLSDERQCPVRLILDAPTRRALQIHLEWSLDGEQQPPQSGSLPPS